MKKSALIVLTGVLMLAFFMTNIGTASAYKIINPSLPDPTATFAQGNPQFTAKVIPTIDLAGLNTLADGMLVPAGFPKGEKQFEGKALLISGLSKTTVNLCFPFNGKNSGWGGQVGYWDGSVWNLLPTTITPAAESSLSWACALATENGQYTFIKWVVDASLLPKTSKPACDFSITLFGPAITGEPEFVDDHVIFSDIVQYLFVSSEDLAGKKVKITFVKSDPIGTQLINGHSSNFVIANSTIESTEAPDLFQIDTVSPLEITSYRERNFDKYNFDFGYCTLDLTLSRDR
ncbi:MAG: hypothetical protein VB013_04615 [Anaerolineaceae bacterium]|nr:hypothetical protein [Anaerolineaceae bacterium]